MTTINEKAVDLLKRISESKSDNVFGIFGSEIKDLSEHYAANYLVEFIELTTIVTEKICSQSFFFNREEVAVKANEKAKELYEKSYLDILKECNNETDKEKALLVIISTLFSMNSFNNFNENIKEKQN